MLDDLDPKAYAGEIQQGEHLEFNHQSFRPLRRTDVVGSEATAKPQSRKRNLSRLLAAVILFSSLAWAPIVHAAGVDGEPAFSSDDLTQLTVFWITKGAEEDVGIEALESQLSDLPLDFRVLTLKELGQLSTSMLMAKLEERLSKEKESSPHYIVCWLEGENPKRFVGVYRGESERLLLRPVEEEGESANDSFVQAQLVALMVRTTVQAILEGGTLGVAMPTDHRAGVNHDGNPRESMTGSGANGDSTGTKENSKESGSESSRSSEGGIDARDGESRWAFSLFYQGRMLSLEHPWQNGGGAMLAFRVWKGLWLEGEFRLFQAAQVESDLLVVRVQYFPIGTGFAYRWQSSAWTFGGRAGFWVAPLLRESVDVERMNGRLASDKRWAVELGAQVAGEVAYRVRPKLKLFLAIGVDAVVRHFQVTERFEDEREVIFRPWLLRPTLSVGIVFGHWGHRKMK